MGNYRRLQEGTADDQQKRSYRKGGYRDRSYLCRQCSHLHIQSQCRKQGDLI